MLIVNHVRSISLTRALILLVIFCVFCLSSCAAADEAGSPEHQVDAGSASSDATSIDTVTSPPPFMTPPDASTAIDVLASFPDTGPSNDRLSSVSTSIDVEREELDAIVFDGFASFADAQGSLAMDAGSHVVDVPRAPPIDVVSAAPDVTSPPDVRPADVVTHAVEVCNGRDDDGNGLIDEIFECSVGRRGSTCVTACGANGYQLCSASCHWNPVCQTYPEDCHDTIDNDCNGLVDCADAACTSDPTCRPPLPPPPVDAGIITVDAGRTDGCHDLIIGLQSTRMPRCASGWVAILYDSDGHPHESVPGGSLTFTICSRLRGVLFLSARCGGEYLLDWPGPVNHPANEGGVASITLDGSELADSESLLCLDRFSPTPGVRPAIPLESFFYGRCP